jgi:hypothetical protein
MNEVMHEFDRVIILRVKPMSVVLNIGSVVKRTDET